MRVLGDIVAKQGRMLGDRTALIDAVSDRRYSFRELAERSARIANGLKALGVGPGDRVAMLLGNSPVCAELPFGITLAGAIMVNVNERLKQEEVAYILEDSGACAVITSQGLLGALEAARDRLPGLRHLVTVDGATSGTQDYESMLAEASPLPPEHTVDPDATAMLIYTSGTTGRPKGVQLTHTNLISSATNWLMECYTDPDGAYLAVGPYYHSGCISHMAALMRGLTVVPAVFDPAHVLDLIERHRITDTLLVPTMIAMLLQQPELLDAHDLSSLRSVFYAASPIPKPVLVKALERFGPIFVQMYGLTETATLSTILRKDDHRIGGDDRRLASCGRPVTHVEVRVGTVETECAPGEPGEVLIRGGNVTPGYWDRPEATAATLVDGWMHTGDIGVWDEEGFLYVVDRKHDMIISGGANVYPSEIEEVLHEHPAIAEATVIGTPDETWGETVVAVVARRPGAELSEQDVIDYCAERLAGYKKPRRVSFVDALPRSAIGKVDKPTLRTQAREAAGSVA
jgi:long-chain acyl-CoA synthetase